jgi:hypothetical protein
VAKVPERRHMDVNGKVAIAHLQGLRFGHSKSIFPTFLAERKHETQYT